MRWLYRIPSTPQEERSHRATLESIDRWWADFAAHADRIDRRFSGESDEPDFDLVGFTRGALNRTFPEFGWEFGAAVNKPGHRLVITPESYKTLRPVVRTLLARAPGLPRWEFYGHRLPEPPDVVDGYVRAKAGGSVTGAKVSAAIGDHRRIDLTFHLPDCRSENDPEARIRAFAAAEVLLGEEVLDTWIGLIDAAPLKSPRGIARLFGRKSQPVPIDLDRLRPTVDALIQSMLDQLPEQPRTPSPQGDPQGAVLKLDPPELDDYPGFDDMFVAVTNELDLWRATHESAQFYSRRFSRAGETFCYLKIDGRDGLSGDNLRDRADIEDALDAALVPAKLGCVTGGGTGRIYSYIDLALTDVNRAIGAIREVLQIGQIPRRTWLLFFDCDLADEWVGIHDNTPPPPIGHVDPSEEED